MKFTIYNPLKGTPLDQSSGYADLDKLKPSTFSKNTRRADVALTQLAEYWAEDRVGAEADAFCLSRRC